MARFIALLNESSPQGGAPVPAIPRAAIAHLWFETVHPFEDGNGRLGRAIAEKTLAQSLEAPTLTALAATINRHKKAYYAELQRASQRSEEHTSDLQSLMRHSYAVFCLKKKNNQLQHTHSTPLHN